MQRMLVAGGSATLEDVSVCPANIRYQLPIYAK
jgi:hypothetical protein